MREYLPILFFVIALLGGDALWKLTIHGDEPTTASELASATVTFCGHDVTPAFDAVADNTTDAVYALCSHVHDGLTRRGRTMRWDTGNATTIVWSCTPIKQTWIWFCLVLSAFFAHIINDPLPFWGKGCRRAAGKGLLGLGIGMVAIYGINILRISAITLILREHPELFTLFHDYIFKYAFYGLMFCGWLFLTHKK